MARPPKWTHIPADKVEALYQIGCTTEEVADFFGVCRDTIEKRFSAEILKGRTNIKIRLRKAQINAALGGNVVMMIFLGKNMLKQSDKVEVETSTKADSPPRLDVPRTDERPKPEGQG